MAANAGALVVGDPPEVKVSSLYRRGEPRGQFVIEHVCNMGAFKFTVAPEENGVKIATAWRPPYSIGEEKHLYVSDVEWVPWHFDSRRPYIDCCRCLGRVTRAFLTTDEPFGRLYCRRCARVRYRSQDHLSHVDRLIQRRDAIRARLGAPSGGALEPRVPDKPRGMHRKTYDRHIADLYAVQVELAQAIEEATEEHMKVATARADEAIQRGLAELERLERGAERAARLRRARL